MPVIEWSDTYLVGIEQVDEHHRHLVTLLNNTYDVFVSHGQKVEIEKVIGELVDYATYHFASEEPLMSQFCFPQADQHLQQHEYFIRQIKSHQADYSEGRSALSLELIVFLKDWLLEHILVRDRELAEFIAAERGKSRAPGLQLDLG